MGAVEFGRLGRKNRLPQQQCWYCAKKTGKMAINKLFVAVVLFVICLNIDNSKSREITSKREIKFDDICEIKFYSERNFIVEQDNFEKTTAHRRRKTDRSMETLGNCCWGLYTKPRYRGRQIIIGSNVKLRKLRRIGKRNRRIRSVEKYEGCNNVF